MVYVPNVPCGVESNSAVFLSVSSSKFPNVPCGVESIPELEGFGVSFPIDKFLMYRVELKVFFVVVICIGLLRVPNVPCGVESTA